MQKGLGSVGEDSLQSKVRSRLVTHCSVGTGVGTGTPIKLERRWQSEKIYDVCISYENYSTVKKNYTTSARGAALLVNSYPIRYLR